MKIWPLGKDEDGQGGNELAMVNEFGLVHTWQVLVQVHTWQVHLTSTHLCTTFQMPFHYLSTFNYLKLVGNMGAGTFAIFDLTEVCGHCHCYCDALWITELLTANLEFGHKEWLVRLETQDNKTKQDNTSKGQEDKKKKQDNKTTRKKGKKTKKDNKTKRQKEEEKTKTKSLMFSDKSYLVKNIIHEKM